MTPKHTHHTQASARVHVTHIPAVAAAMHLYEMVSSPMIGGGLGRTHMKRDYFVPNHIMKITIEQEFKYE